MCCGHPLLHYCHGYSICPAIGEKESARRLVALTFQGENTTLHLLNSISTPEQSLFFALQHSLSPSKSNTAAVQKLLSSKVISILSAVASIPFQLANNCWQLWTESILLSLQAHAHYLIKSIHTHSLPELSHSFYTVIVHSVPE